MKALAQLIVTTILVGCATTEPSAYQKAFNLQTPQTLQPGKRWAITLLDPEGHVWKSFVVKLTDIPAKTCDSEDDREVAVVSESIGSGPLLTNPAYHVSGAALRLQLMGAACDAGYAVIGGVTESGFEGVHHAEVLFAPRHSTAGRAYGVPVAD